MLHRVEMPEPHGHLFHVALRVEHPGDALVVGLPVWTPGSYLVREFARHVEAVTAADGAGRPLAVERLDKHRFGVASRGAAQATVRYRVFAHELTVRTCHLDGTHGFWNGAGLLMYVEGREREPHVLEVAPPRGWRVATALAPAAGAEDPFAGGPGEGPWRFEARDYDELVDAPVEVGTHRLATFGALGKPHAIALWGRAPGLDLERLADDARRVVEQLGGLMGGLPYERYLFIVHTHPTARGGLEHASSTTLLVKRGGFFPRESYEDTLGLFAHEFFHVWNVKRLRPAALVPYDYAREQYTRLLWWFEGVTSYYDELALVRAGLAEPKRWLKHAGEELTALARLPGAAKMSLEEASLTAWVKYYRPDENSANSAVSYYQKGELVALALDLALRRAGGSLDALVRELVERHGAGGLPEGAVEAAVGERLGPAAARAFFDRHVRGTGEVEIDLDVVGLALRRRRAAGLDDKGGTPPKPDPGPVPGWLGANLAQGPKLTVSSVREGSPAWRAGLYAEDEIVAEGGFRIDRAGLWDRLCLAGQGGAVRLTVFRRDELVEVQVPLAPAPEDTIWLEPVPSPTDAQRAAFRAWCGAELPDKV
ncbi:MAG TPA: PDZ domain-containing protein [Anaeromyxobacteraceae bacterium]|nr:PDZ domain-containing protein [Anaeromyxobacteraceae bacterium]